MTLPHLILLFQIPWTDSENFSIRASLVDITTQFNKC